MSSVHYHFDGPGGGCTNTHCTHPSNKDRCVIKVTENGVPLAAIVSVEIREPLRGTFHEPKLDPRYCAIGAHCMPVTYLRLPMTEAEARRLRDEWRKQWPEVAAYLTDK